MLIPDKKNPYLMVLGPAPIRTQMAQCEQRLALHREKLKQVEQRDKAGYFLALGHLALSDYWLFLRDILLYDFLDPWFHGDEVCNFIMETRGQTSCILLPRDGGKSSMITIPYPAWKLAQDPMCLTKTCNAREEKAAQFARSTAKLISNHPRFKACYPYLQPSGKWGEAGYYLDLEQATQMATEYLEDVPVDSLGGTTERDPSIGSLGVSGNFTGAHINGCVILDDMINAEDAKSQVALRRAEAFYQEALRCTNLDADFRINATRWTYYDFPGKLITGELEGKQGRVKVLKVGVEREGANGVKELIWPARKVFDRSSGKERVSGYTWEQIESLRRTDKLFSSLYLNEPAISSDHPFDLNLVKTFKRIPFDLGPVAVVGIEAESQSKAIIDGIMTLAREEGRIMRIESLTADHKEKHSRIQDAIGREVNDGKFNMPQHRWDDDDQSLGGELRAFPKGYDDCLDAVTYGIMMAREFINKLPRVYITMDTAFSNSAQSDRTAIIACCRYKGEFWVLDVECFKSDRTHYLARRLFSMHDKFNLRGASEDKPRIGLNMKGFGVPATRHLGHTREVEFDHGHLFETRTRNRTDR